MAIPYTRQKTWVDNTGQQADATWLNAIEDTLVKGFGVAPAVGGALVWDGTTFRADAKIAAANIAAGAITNTEINAAAAIAKSKLAALGIVDADVSAISLSKLTGYPSDATKYARGDGTWAAITTGAVTATTIAGLGTVADGKLGLLRLGTTPFYEVPVIYDATLAKWVTAMTPFTIPNEAVGSSGTGTNNRSALMCSVPAYGALRTAGMTLQIRVIATTALTGVFGGEVFVVAVGNSAGGSATQISTYNQQSAFLPGPVSLSGNARYTTNAVRDTGWVSDPNAAGTSYDAIQLFLSVNNENTGDSATASFVNGMYRWVA